MFSINTPLAEYVTVVHRRQTVLRTVDGRPCAQRTNLNHLHCTRSAQSSCVSSMACFFGPVVTQYPLRRTTRQPAVLQRLGFEKSPESRPTGALEECLSRLLLAPSLVASFALEHRLVHARIGHPPTAWMSQAGNPAAKSHDVVAELVRLRFPVFVRRERLGLTDHGPTKAVCGSSLVNRSQPDGIKSPRLSSSW